LQIDGIGVTRTATSVTKFMALEVTWLSHEPLGIVWSQSYAMGRQIRQAARIVAIVHAVMTTMAAQLAHPTEATGKRFM